MVTYIPMYVDWDKGHGRLPWNAMCLYTHVYLFKQ